MLKRIFTSKLTFIFIAILILTIIYLVLTNKSEFTLTVISTPRDSSIYVDGNLLVNTNKTKVKTGDHSIRVFRENYLEQTLTVNVIKSTEIKITLIDNSFTKLGKLTELSNLSSPIFSGENLVSKNNNNGKIVVLNKDATKKDEIVLPDNLKSQAFSINGSRILILSENRYFLYNTTNKLLNELDLKQFDPILSLSITNNGKIAISGMYQLSNNLSDIYLFDPESKNSALLAKNVSANFVVPLLNNKLLFIQTLDQANSNTATLYDIDRNTKKAIIQTPDYIKQPVVNQNGSVFAYIGQYGLTSFDYESLNKKVLLKDIPEKTVYTWIDNSRLVVANILKNTVFVLDTTNGEKSQEVEIQRPLNKNLVSISKIDFEIYYYYQDIDTKQISIYTASLKPSQALGGANKKNQMCL